MRQTLREKQAVFYTARSLTATFLLSALLLGTTLPAMAQQGKAYVNGATYSSTYGSSYGGYQDNIPLRGRVSTIPQGTMLMVKLAEPVSSMGNRMGDTIKATLENDLFVSDSIALPAGSEVMGIVDNVISSGHMGKHGEISLHFTSAKKPDGTVVPLVAHVVTTDESGILKGNTYGQDVIKGIGYAAGGTGLGALLGTASGSLIGAAGAGAVFGTAVGGVAGITYALVRQGKDVQIPVGARLSLMTDQPSTVNP